MQTDGRILILSVDVGSVNCLFYIEEFSPQEIIDKKLPIIQDRDKFSYPKTPDPTKAYPSPPYKSVLSEVYKSGNCVFIEKVNFKNKLKVNQAGRGEHNEILLNLFNYMNERKELFGTCIGLLIEEQIKRAPFNQRIQAAISDWFLLTFFGIKMVTVIPAKLRKLAGAIKGKIIKDSFKEFSFNVATEVLALRNDVKTLSIIMGSKKQDDYADAILDLQIFKYLIYVEKNPGVFY